MDAFRELMKLAAKPPANLPELRKFLGKFLRTRAGKGSVADAAQWVREGGFHYTDSSEKYAFIILRAFREGRPELRDDKVWDGAKWWLVEDIINAYDESPAPEELVFKYAGTE